MLKLGSLFDGAGGFPFAAQQYGIKPVWASEIEPFPVAVTTKRFPDMKHLGDVTKINGAEIEPVDIITFGSPCQDLSVAGKRAGLDGERSGLFMEAIRIIKEMRGVTNGRYPTIAIWENVPGAFSSAKGEDFRAVLEAFCKVKDGNAVIPRPPKGKWADAGEIVGDGYSVAWRVLDAQFWGVPQRRRRIFLVADFRGERAGEILFEREGLSRNFAESRETWKGITKSLAFCSDVKERTIFCHKEYGISAYESNAMKSSNPHSGVYEADTARCLDLNGGNPACNQGGIMIVQVHDARGNGDGTICPTVTGDHENRVTDYTAVVVGVNEYNAAETGNASSTLGVNAGMNSGRQQVLVYTIGNGQADQAGLHEKALTLNCMHDQQILLLLNDQGGGVMMCEDGKTSPTIRAQMKHHEPTILLICDRYAVDCGINGDIAGTIDASYFKGTGARNGKEREVVLCVRERCGCEGGGKGLLTQEDKSGTIATSNDQFLCVALDRAAYNQGQNAQYDMGIDESGKAFTVIAKGPGLVCYPINTMVALRGGADDMRTCFGVGENGDPQYTLSSQHEHAICYAVDCRNASIDEINDTLQSKPNGGTSYNLNNCVLVLRPVDIILRRLSPTECARLQGMPDWWCNDVPHADSAEYKMWGNGMALPCVMYVMEGVSEYLRSKEATVC